MYIPAMEIGQEIGRRLDEAMRARGVESQSALSRASGVPQPTINRILKGGGVKGPESATVRKLADALTVSFLWLYEGRGSMDERTPVREDVMELVYVTKREMRLLTQYRLSDERGQEEIEETADATDKRSLSGAVRQA